MIKRIIQEIIDWGPSFSFLEITIQKECFFCFIWVLRVSLRLTLIQKGGLCPLRLLPLMIEFSVCAPSWYNTREQLTRGAERFFEWLQNYIQNKNEEKENKTIIWDLSCTIDKIGRDSENKIKRIYRCSSNCALWKLIVDNGLEDLWRREDQDSPEFTCYDRFFAKDPGYTESIQISILI